MAPVHVAVYALAPIAMVMAVQESGQAGLKVACAGGAERPALAELHLQDWDAMDRTRFRDSRVIGIM
ncbi:hypothetical protein BP5796_06705 [Coleophoma crateriformis]|uniref:Uncharacterized protein n=1 Tax=Coleophoma crateriformis TaxID=565419 RepID=A0A3D8RPS6_9HELO|nr:hypothetical protein BP5796_06705 [Coleophoma crateriformis]